MLTAVICLREDVSAVLPTGFGKSLIYQVIPKVLECLKNESDDMKKFIVCVVSSLEYIAKEQVASINKLHCGLSAAAIGDDDSLGLTGRHIKFATASSSLSRLAQVAFNSNKDFLARFAGCLRSCPCGS